MCRNPENFSNLEFKMASYAAFSEPFSKIAYSAAILTAEINLEFGATCHLGSARFKIKKVHFHGTQE